MSRRTTSKRAARLQPPFAPAESVANAISFAYMTAEANAVIGMRLLGFAGLWPVAPSENTRMVNEKLAALTEASWSMWRASIALHAPHAILAAGLRPVRRTTSANARRLSRRPATCTRR